MTTEEHYINRGYPTLDKFDKKAPKFDYYDLMDFAESYNQAKLEFMVMEEKNPSKQTCIEEQVKKLRSEEKFADVSNSYSKDFKYTLQSKDGKVLLQSVVTFGSKKHPFPKDWKEDGFAQIALQEYKEKFVNENFDIVISESLDD